MADAKPRRVSERIAHGVRRHAAAARDAARRLGRRAHEALFGKELPSVDAPGKPGPGYGRRGGAEELGVAARRVTNAPLSVGTLGLFPGLAGRGITEQPNLLDPTGSVAEVIDRIGAPHVRGLHTVVKDVESRDPALARKLLAQLIDQPEGRQGLGTARLANLMKMLGLTAGAGAAGAGAGLLAGGTAAQAAGAAAGAASAPAVGGALSRGAGRTGMAGARSAFMAGLGEEGSTPSAAHRFFDPTSAAVQRSARAVSIHDPELAKRVREALTGTRQLGLVERAGRGVRAAREAFKQKVASDKLPLPERWHRVLVERARKS